MCHIGVQTNNMSHLFVEVPLHPLSVPGYKVWKCDKCDSAAKFRSKYSQSEVNKIISNKLPCVPEEADQKVIIR